MGTNYFAVMEEKEHDCPTCQRPGYREPVRWHIGKSSGGWCFALHVGSEKEPEIPMTLEAWRESWKTALFIEDEYGRKLEPQEMERIILHRRWHTTEKSEEWYRSNHAEPGPSNLARHQLDDRYCVGHGDGTYDLCPGHFR